MTESRRADGSRRAPVWLLVLMLVLSGLLVPLFFLVYTDDAALSGSTTGTQGSGGRDVSTDGGPLCRDSPVEFEVDGRRYAGTTLVDGGCLTAGETESVTLRYDPDDPDTFSAGGRQWVVPGLIALAALGFLTCLIAVVRRTWACLTRRRSAATRPA